MNIFSSADVNVFRTSVKSHKQKVLSLYKRIIRNIENNCLPDGPEFRYQAVLMRQKFDENKNIKDLRIAKLLLKQGEEYLEKTKVYEPMKFLSSPGGIAYNRYPKYDDIILDFWHPLEKAQYPYYFAKREAGKDKYVELYESDYGDAKKILGIKETINYLEATQNLDVSVDDNPEKEALQPFK